jgi:hypothetical protein
MTDNPMHLTERAAVSQGSRCGDPVGRAVQVGAGHRSAALSNARRRRRQRRPERKQEWQLQARPAHRRRTGNSPMVARGNSAASKC